MASIRGVVTPSLSDKRPCEERSRRRAGAVRRYGSAKLRLGFGPLRTRELGPTAFDVGRRTDMVVTHRRRNGSRDLLEAGDQLANALSEGGDFQKLRASIVKERDDLGSEPCTFLAGGLGLDLRKELDATGVKVLQGTNHAAAPDPARLAFANA